MKLRLTGTADECAAAVEALRVVLDVREVSGFCPNRVTRALGRVYVDVEPPPSSTSTRTPES